jgi:CheY-like chemotaxis protein
MEIRKQPKRILVCEDCRVIGTLVSSLTSNPDNQLATIVLVTSVGVLTEILKTSHFDIIYLDGTLDDRQSTIPVANKLRKGEINIAPSTEMVIISADEAVARQLHLHLADKFKTNIIPKGEILKHIFANTQT